MLKEPKKARWSLAREYGGDEIADLSALSQARLIAEGEISSQELVEVYLDRIERFDGELGAFVEVYADRALREAERADQERSRGKRLGLFHGVPTAVKDHHMVRGRAVPGRGMGVLGRELPGGWFREVGGRESREPTLEMEPAQGTQTLRKRSRRRRGHRRASVFAGVELRLSVWLLGHRGVGARN